MHMVIKRNVDFKTRGCANSIFQRAHTDKNECSSPTPCLCAFRFLCGEINEEERDVAAADLPGFFLQTERDGKDLILLKLIGAIVSLLI